MPFLQLRRRLACKALYSCSWEAVIALGFSSISLISPAHWVQLLLAVSAWSSCAVLCYAVRVGGLLQRPYPGTFGVSLCSRVA